MSNRTFTSRKRTTKGTTVRTITDGRMNAVSYDDQVSDKPVHFLDVNVHQAASIRIDQVLDHLALVISTEDGDRTYVTLYGMSLHTLAVAVDAAQRDEAARLANA
jgi:hypothetical protein